MKTQGCTGRHTQRRDTSIFRFGFTLIELLVVIAIIALLLGILMPGLRSAKRAAESVVCKAHLKAVGNGLSQYTAAWEQWLPGPNTSGITRTRTNDCPELVTPDEPIQNTDWASPTIGIDLGLPSQRDQKILDLLNTKLKCPSNRVRYDYIHPNTLPTLPNTKAEDIYYSSYSAALAFHLLPFKGQATNEAVTDERMLNYIQLGKGYYPKMTMIGTPGEKVYVLEGARYYESSTDQVSFNNFARQIDGGNFMYLGPASPRSTGDPTIVDRMSSTWQPYEHNLRLVWRHNRKMNVVFFDGHCETLDFLDSLEIKLYWPRKSYITPLGASALQDPDAAPGMI